MFIFGKKKEEQMSANLITRELNGDIYERLYNLKSFLKNNPNVNPNAYELVDLLVAAHNLKVLGQIEPEQLSLLSEIYDNRMGKFGTMPTSMPEGEEPLCISIIRDLYEGELSQMPELIDLSSWRALKGTAGVDYYEMEHCYLINYSPDNPEIKGIVNNFKKGSMSKNGEYLDRFEKMLDTASYYSRTCNPYHPVFGNKSKR